MIKIFIRPENIVVILSRRGKNPQWLRKRLGLKPAYFSLIMSKQRSLSGITVKRILKNMRGSSYDDLFDMGRESGEINAI